MKGIFLQVGVEFGRFLGLFWLFLQNLVWLGILGIVFRFLGKSCIVVFSLVFGPSEIERKEGRRSIYFAFMVVVVAESSVQG